MAARSRDGLWIGLLASLPWRTARRDRRAVRTLLNNAEIEHDSALGGELHDMLVERISECRDFFALRGVRTRTPTVLQMAGRSLAADREQAARLEVVVPGYGAPLLNAISQLIGKAAVRGKLVYA
jgi:hypothetical protein